MLNTGRIVSALSLALALTLGVSGCGLMAPQRTTELYAPSDGINASFDAVELLNLLLIADRSGEYFNIVFTGVNAGDTPELVRLTFVHGADTASADFELIPGASSFGNPEKTPQPSVVSLSELRAGQTVNTYIELSNGSGDTRQVPVLDGTLPEYQPYVLSQDQLAATS